jgi:hypothetical protein
MKYIVIGSFCEEMASLYTMAVSIEEAIKNFNSIFGDKIKNFDVTVCDEPRMKKLGVEWKYNGYHKFYGSYNYCF